MNKDQDPNRDNNGENRAIPNNLPPFIKKERDMEKFFLKLSDVDTKETEIFLKLLKSWLVKYSNLDTSLQIGANCEEDLIMNKKSNFARVKIFVDYFELSLKCLQLTNSMENNFIKFSKFVQNLTKKVLLASKRINAETTLFTDIILVNYPKIIEKLNSNIFHKLIQSNSKSGQIFAFKKAFVIKLKPPTFLLWSKKIYYTCDCKGEKGQFSQKFFNIYKTQNEKNSNSYNNVYDSMCSICKKPYIQDKNSDTLIECQEITFSIDTEIENLIDNIITVWTYGDLINSVKEGDCVSLITFYLPNSGKNTYEKDFEYGSFIALNFNMYFIPTSILKENYFSILQSKNFIEGVLTGNHHPRNTNNNLQGNPNTNFSMNFSAKFNENSEIDILRSVNFQRQFSSNLLKFIMQNFILHKKKNLCESSKSNDLGENSKYNFFLHLALDLSIAQRDYLNKTKKSAFMNETETENKSITEDKNKHHLLNSICQSRNLSLKTKIFENARKEKKEKNKNQRSQEEDLQKHFRLSRQIDYRQYFDNLNSSSNHSLMTKPLNILLIFDDVNKDNFQILQNYSKNYKNIISIYPLFNANKFSRENVMRFLITCNNRIVIIPSLDLISKNEIDLIQSIMNDSSQNSNLNIAFWFCTSFNRLQNNGKKNSQNHMWEIKNKNLESILTKCEIVLNFSNKFNRFRGVQPQNNTNKENASASSQKELKIANFAVDFSCENLEKEYLNIIYSGISFSNLSTLKGKIPENKFDLYNFEEFKILKRINNNEILNKIESNICRTNHYYNKSHINHNQEGNHNTNSLHEHDLNFDDSFSSAKLMEDYFIIKRRVSNVDFDDLVNKI